MERYLEGEELAVEEVAHALKDAVTRGELFPVACGVATKNLGTTALLDLLVEGVPSPAKKGSPIDLDGAGAAAFVFKTIADPFTGRITSSASSTARPQRLDRSSTSARTRRSASAPCSTLQGKDHTNRRSSERGTSAPSPS